ncbi:putative 3',5'-cyclic phosphodiesterase pde-3 [Trichinella patagoniensis]|uniref:Putative 3',5'-cyclic phosphodiesterase pde-3 n=1 Tax=Trichinella patagoniensis TaxID=990121 RepID=A0A0V0ZJM4_9BILA|nr:putative 3',5'-cyclic phosphodiesterase pde-3 [Trichinella patagoniensis]
MPLRRATLPSGSLCLSSELVRFQAARALLADVLATKDLPSNVRCALKKVGDLINPDAIHGGLDAFNTPPSDINFPHCGDRIAVHEVNFHFSSKQHKIDACWPASISKRTYVYIYIYDANDCFVFSKDGQLLGGKSIFDWTSVSNVVGLPQMYDDKAATAHDQRVRIVVFGLQPAESRRSLLDSLNLSETEIEFPISNVDSVSNAKPNENEDSELIYRNAEVISKNITLEKLSCWTFPIFAFDQSSNGRILSMMAYKAFESTNLLKTFQIDLHKFFNFFHAIEEGYRDLPYHNRVHASDVLHACFYLTTHWVPAYAHASSGFVSLFSAVELMALYTAAAIHDHDHPGRNNAFLIATQDPKAIFYNDRSVLENHHISSAWQILMRDENFFIENLNNSEYKRFRHFVIETVLATDLKFHFDILMNFTDKISRRRLEFKNESDSLLLGRMIMKLSDVNSASKPADLHNIWTEKILQEFFEQGDEEKQRNLPISDYMDRESCNIAELQGSFMNHVVSPLLNALFQAELLPVDEKTGRCELLENFSTNLYYWRQALENHTQLTLPIQSGIVEESSNNVDDEPGPSSITTAVVEEGKFEKKPQ